MEQNFANGRNRWIEDLNIYKVIRAVFSHELTFNFLITLNKPFLNKKLNKTRKQVKLSFKERERASTTPKTRYIFWYVNI